MTPEQIELDFEHMKLDVKAKGGGETYEDEDFEEFDKESEATDKLLSDTPAFASEEIPKHIEITNEDEWEDVEIDD